MNVFWAVGVDLIRLHRNAAIPDACETIKSKATAFTLINDQQADLASIPEVLQQGIVGMGQALYLQCSLVHDFHEAGLPPQHRGPYHAAAVDGSDKHKRLRLNEFNKNVGYQRIDRAIHCLGSIAGSGPHLNLLLTDMIE